MVVFATGVAAAVLAAACLFGVSPVSGWIALAGAIAGALNALFASGGKTPADKSWMARWVGRVLEGTPYLKLLGGVAWVGAFAMFAVAIFNLWALSRNPLQVYYFKLRGPSVDLLLEGKMDAKWERRLAGQPLIASSDAVRVVQELRLRFPAWETPASVASVQVLAPGVADDGEPSPMDDAAHDRLVNRLHRVKRSVGTAHIPYGELVEDVSEAEVIEKLERDATWMAIPSAEFAELTDTLDQLRDGDLETTGFSITRPARLSDFQASEGVEEGEGEPRDLVKEFLSHVSGNAVPPGLGTVWLYPDDCRGTFAEELVPPTMQLEVVVFRNVTGAPIELGEFRTASNAETRLRSRLADAEGLEDAETKAQRLVPIDQLADGQAVVAALRVEFDDPGDVTPRAPDFLAQANQILAGREDSVLRVLHLGEYVGQLRAKTLMAMLARGDAWRSDALGPLVYGPSMVIHELDVGGSLVPVRQRDPTTVAMLESEEVGSCPYVYTRDDASSDWIKEGHVIAGRVGVEDKGTSRLVLKRFDGSLRIQEEDDEVSYLDEVSVTVVEPDGSRRLLQPSEPLLVVEDGQAMVLARGDVVDLTFPAWAGASDGSRVVLNVTGYYEPYPFYESRQQPGGFAGTANVAHRRTELSDSVQ